MAETEATPAAKQSPADKGMWTEALWLPCRLTVDLPIPQFTIGDLMRLDVKSVVDSLWAESGDLPIRVNGQLIGWGEFEVVGDRLAVRLTELA